MEPEVSSSCSQDTTTGSYPEPDESNPHPLKIHSNILPSTSTSSKCSLPSSLLNVIFSTF